MPTTTRTQTGTEVVLPVRATGVRNLLLAVAVVLCTVSLGLQLARVVWPGVPFLESIAAMTNVSREASLPTLTSALGLLLLAVLAWALGSAQARQGSSPWWGRAAAGVAAFMAVDEFLELHERMIEPTRAVLGGGTGILYYTWVVPAAVLVVLVLVTGDRWLRRLGAPARRSVLTGVAVFLAGAIGLELVAGLLVSSGTGSWGVLTVLSTAEEFLEMAGAAIVAGGLLTALAGMGIRFVPTE
ncbi:hypothetical protein [Aquipuribacter sp. MA13-6]|uniref:hypothetical protein n=1 Tax=unclassified Aquipuribacter TaxID=2635084 RepID=UPI003EE88E26